MSEASQNLDLASLKQSNEIELIPKQLLKSMFRRLPDGFILSSILLILVTTLIKSILATTTWLNPLLAILIYLILRRRNHVKNRYKLVEDGILIPFTWFSRTKLSWSEILRIRQVELAYKDNDKKINALEIAIDSKKYRLNVSGLTDSALQITSELYAEDQWSRFSKACIQAKQQRTEIPNTQAHRLEVQVLRAWKHRWVNYLLSVFDRFTELLYYISVLYITVNSMVSIPNLLIPIFVGVTIFPLLIANFANVPDRVVGIRPNELGPLIYNEDQLFTNVRLVAIVLPNPLRIEHAEIIYEESPQSQRIKQIEPRVIEPGVLQHLIIQFYGNHSHAAGIRLIIRGIKSENEHMIEQYWS